MRIKIYGSGCPNCIELEKNTKKALEEMGKEAGVEHITDLGKIIEAGVLMTPALEIKGKIVSQGKILSPDEIKKFLE